jgi:hypothetical protein
MEEGNGGSDHYDDDSLDEDTEDIPFLPDMKNGW